MIIHSPIFSGSISQDPNNAYANLSGSFTGSFKGIGQFEGLEADSVAFDNVTNKPTLVSGSSQVSYPDLSNIPSGIVSSSAQIDSLFNIDGVFSGSSQVEFNEVNNNPFSQSASSVTVSKSIIPTSTNLDLGSSAVPFRDLYLSSASLYIDGQQVISTADGDLNITTDANQSLRIVEEGADTLTLQTENGDITLVATGTGTIELNAPIQIQAGKQILSSDGNPIVFGEDISVQGNIIVLGAVDGVDLASLKTQFDILQGKTFITGSSQVSYPDLSNIPAGIVSGSSQVTPLLPSGVVSGSSQVNADSITNFDTNVKDKLNTDLVVSGSASDVKTFLSLGNVTNESKATMFSSPTFTGTVSGITATMVGLGNVTNESKATMFTNAALTGTPTAPTAPANTNSTQIATTAYVQQELTDLIGGANEAFDTLIEISASLASGDSQLNTLVDGKLSKASNLSDLTNTSTARINLGVAIGSDVQAYHANLAAVADGTYTGDDSITTIGTVNAGSVTAILPTGVVSGSVQVNHDSTTGFVANEHIDHSSVSITAGNGLTGGGTIAATRTINVVGTADRISVSADAVDIASTYVGQTSITTLGTIGTGTWQGSVIASAYLDSDTAHLSGTQTFTGAKTFSNSTASTTTTTGAVIVTGGVGIGGALNVGGDVVAYASSDRRLKDNIQNIENPIQKVQKLNGVTWDWNSNADELQQSLPNVGVIAQEVEEIFPQLVHDRDNGYKGVDYAKLTGLLIEAIKEQQKQIDELKSRL